MTFDKWWEDQVKLPHDAARAAWHASEKFAVTDKRERCAALDAKAELIKEVTAIVEAIWNAATEARQAACLKVADEVSNEAVESANYPKAVGAREVFEGIKALNNG